MADGDALGGAFYHDLDELAIVFDELERLALLDRIQRRLRNVNVAALDEFLHVPKEERQQQRADVRTVDVGVGHQDDLAVADFARIEVVFRNAGAQRRDHATNFFVGQHLVVAGFFHVENFTFERQNGLEAAVAPLLGGATCGFSLDQIKLATFRITLGTIRQLAGKASAIQHAFAASQIASLAGSFTRARRVDGFVDHLAGYSCVLLKERTEFFVDERLHNACDIGIQLAFGLTFKLRLRQLYADHGDQAFANVIARQILFYVFE